MKERVTESRRILKTFETVALIWTVNENTQVEKKRAACGSGIARARGQTESLDGDQRRATDFFSFKPLEIERRLQLVFRLPVTSFPDLISHTHTHTPRVYTPSGGQAIDESIERPGNVAVSLHWQCPNLKKKMIWLNKKFELI